MQNLTQVFCVEDKSTIEKEEKLKFYLGTPTNLILPEVFQPSRSKLHPDDDSDRRMTIFGKSCRSLVYIKSTEYLLQSFPTWNLHAESEELQASTFQPTIIPLSIVLQPSLHVLMVYPLVPSPICLNFSEQSMLQEPHSNLQASPMSERDDFGYDNYCVINSWNKAAYSANPLPTSDFNQ